MALGGVVAAGVALSAYGNYDPDIYWHRIIGHWFLQHQSLSLAPDPIAYTSGDPWITTSWASDVLYALLHASFGYAGIAALRLLLTTALLGVAGLYLARRLPLWQATLWLGLAGLPLALAAQDRPQTFSLVFTALLLPSVEHWLTGGDVPRPVPALAFTWVWANVHGLWLLAPALLALAATVELAHGRPWRRAALTAAGCVGAAALTPVGPELLLTPLRVRSAASAQIAEWGPTAITQPFAWGFAAVFVGIVVHWTRRQPPARHVWYVFAVTGFGLLARRNAAFASLLLLPPLALSLQLAGTKVSSTLETGRWRCATVVFALMVAGAATYLRVPPVPNELPFDIASRLAASKQPLRVVNDYNIAGFLREYGGDHVRVAIDGRSDRYGQGRIRRYGEMLDGQRGWHRRLARLRPDAVVVERRSALVELLHEDRWVTTVKDGRFELLERAR
jgi:hypothetical protein